MDRFGAVVFVCAVLLFSMALSSSASDGCFTKDTVPKLKEAVAKDAFKGYDVDWDSNGVKDKVMLAKSGECTQLVIAYYDRKNGIARVEFSGNIGPGETASNPTGITIDNNILSLKRQEMRNELTAKFRYDKKTRQTVVTGKEVEYYGSGAYGPSRVSINYLTRQKLIFTSVLDEKRGEYTFHSPKKRNIKNGPKPLSATNMDTMYDDTGNE